MQTIKSFLDGGVPGVVQGAIFRKSDGGSGSNNLFDGGTNTSGVEKVILRSSDERIDGMGLIFRDGTSTSWAGGYGGTKSVFSVPSDDCISAVTVWSSGGNTAALRFHTKNGVLSPRYGGGQQEGSEEQVEASAEECELIGIHGRSGAFLEKVVFRWGIAVDREKMAGGLRREQEAVDQPSSIENKKNSLLSTSNNNKNLHYPLLAGCRVQLLNPATASCSRPPVKLPPECLDLLENSLYDIPEPYDFALERTVLHKKQERDLEQQRSTTRGGGNHRDEVEDSVLVKLKTLTNANDEVCIALLEEHGYDLETSVETFFQSER